MFRGIAIGALIVTGLVEVAILLTPLPPVLNRGLSSSVRIVDREGRPLRMILADGSRFSRRVTFDELSPAIVCATISAEDKRFRYHPGVDPFATVRAIVGYWRGDRMSSGASTISQQVIKLASPGSRTAGRKLGEIWRALKLEQVWSKDRILVEYLNRLQYGNLCTGIATASRFYFGKPPADLSIAEAAYLAGIPKAPGRLNPYRNPKAALERQRWVLSRMYANGLITSPDLRRALVEPLLLEPPGRYFEAPHFVELLLRRKGLPVDEGEVLRTSLDLELNRFVEKSLSENLADIADRNAGSGAVVVIRNASGEVLALAGSGDYFEAGTGQVNGAWIIRSPGSSVKPFTYLLALENGAEPCSVVPDIPTEFATETGIYRPNNYNHRFYGPVSLRFSLGNSLNVGAIRTLQLAGGPEVLHRFLRRIGITTLGHPASYYGLGLTLGNGEVRLLELANAYACLARLGVYRPYRLMSSARDSIPTGVRVASREGCWQIADMLSDNAARLASFGPNSYLHFDFPAACKTGTSSDYRDNWSVCYTPEFTVAIWVGNPDGSAMRRITGVTGAAPVMHEVMTHLHERFGTSWFKRPEGLRHCAVEPLTGRSVSADRKGAVMEWCRVIPERERADDYDEQGRVRLAAEYREWVEGPQNSLGDLAVIAETAPTLRILEPEAGSIYYIDNDLPPENQWIPLRAEGAQDVQWVAGSGITLKAPRFKLAEGRHTLTVRDRFSGEQASTWIEVRAW
jgi:penicillin-binding protein 1C